MSTDLKAANYVLFNSYDYPKPELMRFGLRKLFGSGVFSSCCKKFEEYPDDLTIILYRTSKR